MSTPAARAWVPASRGSLLLAHLPLLSAALGNPRYFDALDRAGPASVLEFARRHRVSASLAFLLARSGLGNRLHPEVAAALEEDRTSQAAAAARLLASLDRIADALHAARVDWLLLKGVGLALQYYGALDRRATRDVDVLVRPPDLPRAEAALASLGYACASWAPLRPLALRFTHAFDYVGQDGIVDLHWTPGRHPSFRFDVGKILERRRTLVPAARTIAVPDDEDALACYLVSAFSDLQRRGLSARPLIDLHLMLAAASARLDWRGFLRRRRAEGTCAIAVNMLAFLLDVLDAADRLPEVAAVVERERAAVRLDADGHRRLLTPDRYALANKRWAMRLYDTSLARSASWWAVSLPVRALVHRGWQQPRGR